MSKYLFSRQITDSKGFTLIEMLIVVAIIGILAAIAYPSYQNYVIKTKRTDMMSELQQMATRIEAQKLAQGTYSNIPLSSVYGNTVTGGKTTYPVNDTALYDVSISYADSSRAINTTNMTGGDWTLTAEPINTTIMKGDGDLSIDHNGNKCHDGDCSKDDGWKK